MIAPRLAVCAAAVLAACAPLQRGDADSLVFREGGTVAVAVPSFAARLTGEWCAAAWGLVQALDLGPDRLIRRAVAASNSAPFATYVLLPRGAAGGAGARTLSQALSDCD